MDCAVLLQGELLQAGADLVGFADLTALPAEARQGLPAGVAVAVKYPKDVICGIMEGPTPEYYRHYIRLNQKLDRLVTFGAEYLQGCGFAAIAQTVDKMAWSEPDFATTLPHKTVATKAGLGWIGKSALLVTEQYGSMIRLSSILTDAPLEGAEPVTTSRCGSCMVCTDACPGGAVLGNNWNASLARGAYFDAAACRRTAGERSIYSLGEDVTICGRCILVCPYTQRYLNQM